MDALKAENLKKLDPMSVFQEDWNGVGGQAFSENAISVFRDIIENVHKQPEIAPTGRNSLLMRYKFNDNTSLQFEVRENRVDMVCIPHGDHTSAFSDVFTCAVLLQINRLIRIYS
jgi:hypothetical protein